MGMFGRLFSGSSSGSNPLATGYNPKAGTIAGFNPTSSSLIDKIGLVGDILTGNPVTKNRLDEDYAFQQAQYQAQHPAAQNVGGNLVQLDPATGQYKTVYSPPAGSDLDAFGKTLQGAGFTPGTPEWQQQYKLKVQNEVDPIHAYPTTDAQGNSGLLFKRPSEMGGVAGTQPVQIKDAAGYQALPPGTPYIDPTGQHRVKGGAAPSTATGSFPLYPNGYRRN